MKQSCFRAKFQCAVETLVEDVIRPFDPYTFMIFLESSKEGQKLPYIMKSQETREWLLGVQQETRIKLKETIENIAKKSNLYNTLDTIESEYLKRHCMKNAALHWDVRECLILMDNFTVDDWFNYLFEESILDQILQQQQ